MKLYRFSPIRNREELLEAVKHVHSSCNQLCKESLGNYLPNAGNIGIFCHYNDEYDYLVGLRKRLCEPSDDPNQKYFKLQEAIVIKANEDIPEGRYTHLYIRKPDIYRAQVGDVDFYLEQSEYINLKDRLNGGEGISGARVFPRQDLDMIELFNPDVDALAYISTQKMTEKVHIKLSNETNL